MKMYFHTIVRYEGIRVLVCLKSPHVSFTIMITNIAFDRIHFLVLSLRSAISHKCCIFSTAAATLPVPTRNENGMESGAGNWKEGSCCVVGSSVPTAISCEHASLVHSPDAHISIIHWRPEGKLCAVCSDVRLTLFDTLLCSMLGIIFLLALNAMLTHSTDPMLRFLIQLPKCYANSFNRLNANFVPSTRLPTLTLLVCDTGFHLRLMLSRCPNNSPAKTLQKQQRWTGKRTMVKS